MTEIRQVAIERGHPFVPAETAIYFDQGRIRIASHGSPVEGVTHKEVDPADQIAFVRVLTPEEAARLSYGFRAPQGEPEQTTPQQPDPKPGEPEQTTPQPKQAGKKGA